VGRDRQEASLTAERATGALFAALFAAVVAGPPRVENDVYWHLSIGRLLARGTFPRTDPLATAQGTTNILLLHPASMGTVGTISIGPGVAQTAYGLLSDLVDITRTL